MSQVQLLLRNFKERIKGSSCVPVVKELDFSSRTYQVLVEDLKDAKEHWCFIQLSPDYELKDCFCDCDEEIEDHCLHLLAALKFIFVKKDYPLHLSFEASFWKQFCMILARKSSFCESKLCVSSSSEVSWKEDKNIFFLKPKSKKSEEFINNIFVNREKETEGNSIKFSTLPLDEIKLWRKGSPKEGLRFELSCWGDLAKWLFLLQCHHSCNVEFSYDSNEVPNAIKVIFPQLEFNFSFNISELELFISSLSTLPSSLDVFQGKEEVIESMTYDSDKGALLIEHKALYAGRHGNTNEIIIGPWSYLPRKGFYFNEEHPLLHQKELQGMDIGFLLDAYPKVIKKFILPYVIDERLKTVSYHLCFDEDFNLHLNPYLFQWGDLQKNEAQCFGRWVFLFKKGFYRVEGLIDEDCKKIVKRGEVGQFVSHYQNWLADKKGYETHLTKIEASLSFCVEEDQGLLFEAYTELDMEGQTCVDFGEWVYLEGQGFYSKHYTNTDWPVKAGMKVSKSEAPRFIDVHSLELEQIKGFFSGSCPITDAYLNILYKDNKIIISPNYSFFPGYESKCLFYFPYVYVREEGFAKLPNALRLPQKYYKEVILSKKEDIEDFLHTQLSTFEKKVRFIDPHLRKPESIELCCEYAKREDTERNKIIMGFYFKTEFGRTPLVDIWGGIKSKQRYLFSTAGLIDLEDARYSWVSEIGSNNIETSCNRFSLSTIELIRLLLKETVNVVQDGSTDSKNTQKLLEEMLTQKTLETLSTDGLESQLRPYQDVGLQWLWFLYCNGLSGLLCDDMGLGKTHQAMALLAAIWNKFSNKKASSPKFLVVCPTSVIYHWEEKLASFFPHLNVYTFHGIKRNLDFFKEGADLLLTSYGVLRVEIEAIEKIGFELSIFDEMQIAKNSQSQVHKALKRLSTTMGLGLTGTPLENHLRELKALFDVVLLGYMPSEAKFKEEFMVPIERHCSSEARDKLKNFIKPFILRRKKTDVLQELPEKTEELARCDLMPEQEELYQRVLSSSRRSLLNQLEGDERVPFIHIFALLAKLKQICNHPASFHGDTQNYKKYQSGKWQLFVELLGQARESCEKVVVFTQYLNMLEIFEKHLKEVGTEFALIKGSTTNRRRELQKFHEDPNCQVFLGSLGAVGLGVDLTPASIVIHYDRWWNPAKEQQATDRVHRMGQKRGVQVFKLITKNTIEERIDEIINSKNMLIEDIVGVDDQSLIKTLSKNQLVSLLSDMHELS
jgi:superfamily II DNA or RNA helicase